MAKKKRRTTQDTQVPQISKRQREFGQQTSAKPQKQQVYRRR